MLALQFQNRKNKQQEKNKMKDFAKSIRTWNSIPGSWRRANMYGIDPQMKEYKEYTIYVYKEVEKGWKTWWTWELDKNGDNIRIGEATTESGAKAAAQSALEQELRKTGNSKIGNSNKAEIIEKKKKEGATLKVDNGQKLEFSDGSTYVKTTGSDDYREAHNYVGNSKVGNANTHLTASNSGELWLNYDGTGEMYDPIELGRYNFSGKSEALSVARELEQLKRKAEQKVKDADKFISAIKQWASGLK